MDQGTHDTPPAIEWASDALRDVAAERRRQIEVEGWTPEHDDVHARGQMAQAAACYALFNTYPTPTMWPWGPAWWKPTENHRRNLVRAGALILAEIERLDRLQPNTKGEQQ